MVGESVLNGSEKRDNWFVKNAQKATKDDEKTD